jgi:transposase InsO family protein
LYEVIFTRFGVPRELMTDQGAQFTSNLINVLMNEYTIRHGKSSPYHPQVNGQAKITNRELEATFTKTIQIHKKDWGSKLLEVLWAYKKTWKKTIGFTPFELVYEKTLVMPIEFEHKTLCTALELNIDLHDAQQEHIL